MGIYSNSKRSAITRTCKSLSSNARRLLIKFCIT